MWPEDRSGPALRADLKVRLRLPLFVAPMFLITGPDLIIASARAGVLSAFPSVNARSPRELDRWLSRIAEEGGVRRILTSLSLGQCARSQAAPN